MHAKMQPPCLNHVYSGNHQFRPQGSHATNSLEKKLFHIPQIKWKCPPKIVLSDHWHVATGEESEELKAQKQMETRAPEQVYSLPYSVLHSPSFPLDVQDNLLDDSHVPLIPLTPIEEEVVDSASDMAAPENTSNTPSLALSQGILNKNPKKPWRDPPASLELSANAKPAIEVPPSPQADVAAAAAATAMTAILKSKEQGSLIDTNLLIKFLSNPTMIKKLINAQQAPPSTESETVSGSMPFTASSYLASTKPGMHGDGALQTASASISVSKQVKPSVAIPVLKPGPVIKKSTRELGVAANTGAAPISGSKLGPPIPEPVIERVVHKHTSATDAAAPVSGSKLMTSWVAFRCPTPDPVVKNLTDEPRAPSNAPFSSGKLAAPPPASLPSSKPDMVKIKRMINEYGSTENESISRSMPTSLQVPLPTKKLDVVLPPPGVDSHPFPSAGESGLQFQGLTPDAGRLKLNALPKLMQLDEQVPNAAGLNLPRLPNIVLPNQRVKGLSPDSVQIPPLPAMAAPPPKDMNYIKNLIRQHGEIQQTREYYHLSQPRRFHAHPQELKLVPNLKPNELTQKALKPCIYYNSPKGCRNGSNCLYRHDKPINLRSGRMPEVPSTKRMKLGGEVTGWT